MKRFEYYLKKVQYYLIFYYFNILLWETLQMTSMVSPIFTKPGKSIGKTIMVYGVKPAAPGLQTQNFTNTQKPIRMIKYLILE